MNKNNSKKISIVLPVYNGEKYLSQSIDSIINQTYKNWELIIVNDCSTDNSSSIISRYCLEDKRIRTINNKTNMRLPTSLNIGFNNANGKYYTWTSDDNYYEPTALKTMVEYLNNNPEVDLVYANYNLITKENNVRATVFVNNPEDIWKKNIVGACFLYRRSLAIKTGAYDPTMFLAEDSDYFIRCHQNGLFKKIDKVLYNYRLHEYSLTSTQDDERINQYYKARSKHSTYLLTLCKTKSQKREFYFILFNYIKRNKKLRRKFITQLSHRDKFFILYLLRKYSIRRLNAILKNKTADKTYDWNI